jgi:hypothetical protein
MTLVVGRVTEDIGFLVADTFLSTQFQTDETGPVNGQFHALKIQILNADIAVAFSGDAAPSLTLIKELHAQLESDASIDVPRWIFKSYRTLIEQTKDQHSPDYDFLVLELTPYGRKLTLINSAGTFDRKRAYIGDSGEYKRLMGLRRPHCSPKFQDVQQPDGTFRKVPLTETGGEVEFAELADAMERLVSSRISSTVGAIGDIVTRVVDARISGKLEYLQQHEASISPEEGRSGFAVLASNSGTRGMGIFYVSGRLGFLFIVGDSEPCRAERARTLAEFVELARKKYGLNLS